MWLNCLGAKLDQWPPEQRPEAESCAVGGGEDYITQGRCKGQHSQVACTTHSCMIKECLHQSLGHWRDHPGFGETVLFQKSHQPPGYSTHILQMQKQTV